MPCYSCAMKSQGIVADGWITATTVRLAITLYFYFNFHKLTLYDTYRLLVTLA